MALDEPLVGHCCGAGHLATHGPDAARLLVELFGRGFVVGRNP